MSEYTYDDLRVIMSRLRGEGGCPWDRKQTHESLRGATIEEAYEFADAVDRGDALGMCEELGDLLMLTVLHSTMAEESGAFTNADVIDGVCRKMISRHSHVFGADKADSAEEALAHWNRNKGVEKAYRNTTDTLKSVPRALPALMRAHKIQSRAETQAPSAQEILCDLQASVSRLSAVDNADVAALTEQIGNILWKTVHFSRISKINAEFALTNAVETFINRFEVGESQ